MKIIHTSDIHLASALTSRLPSSKVASRRRELMGNLSRMTEFAKKERVGAIIIAGDLFDTERVSARDIDSVLATIEGAREVAFFYLPGNHEGDILLSSGQRLPENLFIFGDDWTYFKLGDTVICGRAETSKDMFDTLMLDEGHKNIAVLHGELRDRSEAGGVIGLSDAAGRNIDYLALGHYHKYSKRDIDKRGVAVYSGAPEGRGFDEVGEMGFSLIDTDMPRANLFIPFAKRKLLITDVDISGAFRSFDVAERISAAVADMGKENLITVNLVGKRELSLSFDTELMKEKLLGGFYYAKIKDSSKLVTRAEDFVNDKSLKGEFIRLCLSDTTLTDDEKQKIIHCGLSALGGEAFDE